jgi:hypothetical protein
MIRGLVALKLGKIHFLYSRSWCAHITALQTEAVVTAEVSWLLEGDRTAHDLRFPEGDGWLGW